MVLDGLELTEGLQETTRDRASCLPLVQRQIELGGLFFPSPSPMNQQSFVVFVPSLKQVLLQSESLKVRPKKRPIFGAKPDTRLDSDSWS